MNVSEEQRNGKNINARVHLHILFPKIKSVYKMLKGEIYSQGSQQSEQSVVHHVTSLFAWGHWVPGEISGGIACSVQFFARFGLLYFTLFKQIGEENTSGREVC